MEDEPYFFEESRLGPTLAIPTDDYSGKPVHIKIVDKKVFSAIVHETPEDHVKRLKRTKSFTKGLDDLFSSNSAFSPCK
jgi:TRAP-type uncharacterized transport system substrate-binding protein